MKKNFTNNQSGFTLVELLISISVMVILITTSVPVYKTLQEKNDIESVGIVVASALRQAQILSQASKGDSNWSIKIEIGKITIFKGTNFLSRDVSQDKEHSFSSGVSITGLTEIDFEKNTGLPQNIGALIISKGDDTKEITINTKGAIDYE